MPFSDLFIINKAMMYTALNNGALRQKLNYFLSAFSSTVSALSGTDKVSEKKSMLGQVRKNFVLPTHI